MGNFIKTVQRIAAKIILDGPAAWAPRGLTGHVGRGNGDAHCAAWLAGGRFSKVN
jgi:hypothetical protein